MEKIKDSKAEFQYLCDYYQISRVPIFGDSGYFCGFVTRDLRYDYTNADRYYRNKEYALDVAFRQIHDVISLIKELNQVADVVIVRETSKMTWEYDDGRGYVTHHVYPRTIKTEEEEVVTDTLDKVFERFEKKNRTVRYCNDVRFKFKDAVFCRKHSLWSKIISESRSFDLYYGKGTVD